MPPPSDTAQPNKIAAGVIIPAELNKSIDAKKAKPGDPVEAKTSQDLLSNGQIVIPRGTRITGHITAAKPHEKSDPASSVGIAFDQIAIKDGTPLPFQADIQAIGKSPQSVAPVAGDPMPDGSGMSSPGSSTQPVGGMNRPGMSQPAAPPSPVGTGGQTASAQASSGVLSPGSHGGVGMDDLSLSPPSGDPSQGSTISSTSKNVHLDDGTQLILRTK